MASLSLLALGVFIGFVVVFGLHRVENWNDPGKIFSAAISAAVAAGVFAFIKLLGGKELGSALFFYPVGLLYGALCTNAAWTTDIKWEQVNLAKMILAILHLSAIAIATVLLFILWYWYG
jgi:hypothetical protein